MASLTGGFKGAAIAALPLDGARTIIDVGGADGTMLAAILAAHLHMHGVLFDLPHVIAGAPAVLAGHGVGSRTERVAGDFLEAMPTWPRSSRTTGRASRPGRILANIAAAGGKGASNLGACPNHPNQRWRSPLPRSRGTPT